MTEGYSLIELLFATTLTLVVGATTLMPLRETANDYRAAGAARYVASVFQRARMEAVARSANVAIQFQPSASTYGCVLVVDGNADGVRTTDLRRGIDRGLTVIEHLPDNFPGVDFGVVPGLPPVDPGGTPPGTDPIKLGSSNLLSFAPTGSSSSGSVYIRGQRSIQFVVRVFGETGRTRVLRLDARLRQWKPL